ncbi:MAG TPA: DUF2069 domain-containing protein [Rhodanobacteraceae bacterium]
MTDILPPAGAAAGASATAARDTAAGQTAAATPSVHPRVDLQQRIGFIAWGALAVLQIVWHAWWLPPAHAPIGGVLALALIPLAIPLLYWRRPERALLLTGMFSLFYFCHGVVEAWAAPRERAFAWVEIALTIIIVLACAKMPKRRAR